MSEKPVIIKKYPNRRLYRTDQSKYITLDDLKELVKQNRDFLVQDAKTGEDLTQSTLVQIIFEQEAKTGAGMLPANFLKRLILFYDDNLKNILPSYLETSMDAFYKNQGDIREFMQKQLGNQFGTMFPMPNVQDLQKRNMDFFNSYMKMLGSINPIMGYWNKDNK